MEQRFGIVLTAKMRHGDLWDAAKQFGSASALARHLMIDASKMGEWINLKKAPSLEFLDSERGQEIIAKLILVCNKTAEELWPLELRVAIAGGEIGKRIERRQEVGLAMLAHNAETRLLLPSPEDVAAKNEVPELIEKWIHVLSPRLRRVLELRFGLNGNDPCTFEQAGKLLGVSQERFRQLLNRALQKLRDAANVLSPSVWQSIG